jgi:hypothetical protein
VTAHDESVDAAIRALARNVAQATVERCAELLTPEDRHSARSLLDGRLMIAEEIAELTMECADECADSEVNPIRSLAGGA